MTTPHLHHHPGHDPFLFRQLLAAIDRTAFERRAAQAEAYDKRFGARDHLLALTFAQLSGATSLRDLELRWNALQPPSRRPRQLTAGPLHPRRCQPAPARLFADTFTALAKPERR